MPVHFCWGCTSPTACHIYQLYVIFLQVSNSISCVLSLLLWPDFCFQLTVGQFPSEAGIAIWIWKILYILNAEVIVTKYIMCKNIKVIITRNFTSQSFLQSCIYTGHHLKHQLYSGLAMSCLLQEGQINILRGRHNQRRRGREEGWSNHLRY